MRAQWRRAPRSRRPAKPRRTSFPLSAASVDAVRHLDRLLTEMIRCVAVHRSGPAHVVYLASQSPRRRQLLAQIGVDFEVVDVDVPEVRAPGEAAAAYVSRVARDK